MVTFEGEGGEGEGNGFEGEGELGGDEGEEEGGVGGDEFGDAMEGEGGVLEGCWVGERVVEVEEFGDEGGDFKREDLDGVVAF